MPIRRTRVRAAWIVLLACTATSCGGGDAKGESGTGPAPNGAAASLRVTLSDSIVVTGRTLQATATAYTAAGVPVAGQPSVRWSLSDTTLASITANGTVTAKKAGVISVVADLLNASGGVQLTGQASARARWEAGAWYMADSLLVPYSGTWGVMAAIPLAGNKAVLVMGGSEVGAGGVPTCAPSAPASVLVSASGQLTLNNNRILETSRSQLLTYHMLTADFNGDGNTDVHFAGSGCDISNPLPNQRDVPKVLLGDGTGGFRETLVTSPQVQQHAAAIGPTRPNGAVDILMLSGLCYSIRNAGGDTLAVQYRGANWIPACAAPGPFVLRGKGDGTFSYDNTSFSTELARAIVGDSTGTAPNIAGAAMCDANGDGWNDLVITRKDARVHAVGAVYLNDKTGRFFTPPLPLPRPTNGQYTSDVYCRDLDGDGRMDILATRIDAANASFSGNLVTDWNILRGNGDGTFVNVTTTALPGQQLHIWTPQINVVDLNRDGFVDIVGARAEGVPGQQLPIWFGTATPGVFRNATERETPTMPWGIGASLATYPAFHLIPVTIGSETMLVSRVERSSIEGAMSPQLAAIPLRHALIRVFRRAP